MLLETLRRVGEGAKRLFGFYVKKKMSFSNRNMKRRETALSHYLGQITRKCICSESSTFRFDIVRFDSLAVSKHSLYV